MCAREVEHAVDEYQRRAHLGEVVPLGDPGDMTERVLRSVTDFGPLSELLARADVEEIFVEGARVSYLDTTGRLRGLTVPTTEDENRRILDRMLATTDRQLNAKHPIVQARVLGGSVPGSPRRSRRSPIACRPRCGATRCATSRSADLVDARHVERAGRRVPRRGDAGAEPGRDLG